MDSTSAWKGEKKFLDDSGNRVIAIDARKNKKQGFTQDADTKEFKKVKLTFRYKSSDYKGVGFEIGKLQGTFQVIDAKVDGAWHNYTWEVGVGNTPKTTLKFFLHEGTGTMLFDDIVVEGIK